MRITTKTLGRFNLKGLFLSAVIALGIVSFVFTGLVDRYNNMDMNVAAFVGGQSISMRNVQELAQQSSQRQGGQQTEEQKNAAFSSALDQLIQEKIFVEEATRLNWQPSDFEVARWIQKLPVFQNPETKAFDKTRFQKFLKSGQMSELDLSRTGKDVLARERMEVVLRLSPAMPDKILRDIYMRDNLKFEFEYAEIRPSAEALKNAIIEEAHKNMAKPETTKQLEEMYNQNKEDYNRKAQVRLATILYAHKTAQKAEGAALQRSPEEAKKMAEQALQDLTNGKSFTEVSSKGNDDVKAKQSPYAELDWIDDTGLDPQSVKAAFALSKEKPWSGVVETPFGFRVMKFLDGRPAVQKTFEQAKEELARKSIAGAKRGEMINVVTKQFEEARAKKDTAAMSKIFADNNITWQKPKNPVTATTNYVDGLGSAEDVISELFALKNPGDMTQGLLQIRDKRIVLRLVARHNPPEPTEKQLTALQRQRQGQEVQESKSYLEKKLLEIYNKRKDIHKNKALVAL